jgi:hypothetical protein
MKQTAKMDRIQELMKPGATTRDGLLGEDVRKLGDILIEDDASVKRLELTHTAIADRMQHFRDTGEKGLGEPIKIDDTFIVRVDGVRGKLPCPFGDGGFPEKVNTTVENIKTGKSIVFTDLNIHMIREHGFYEGIGSPFRNSPATLAEVLEISTE